MGDIIAAAITGLLALLGVVSFWWGRGTTNYDYKFNSKKSSLTGSKP